jgi:hypothetical protein
VIHVYYRTMKNASPFLAITAAMLPVLLCNSSPPPYPLYANSGRLVTVYNTYGHGVLAWEDVYPPLSETIIEYYNNQVESLYPNACRVYDPNNASNCYAYSFNDGAHWFINAPTAWMSDYYWFVIAGLHQPDQATISYIDSQDAIKIIYGPDTHYGYYIGYGYVDSKWGIKGAYIHEIAYCPYSDEAWYVYKYKP